MSGSAGWIAGEKKGIANSGEATPVVIARARVPGSARTNTRDAQVTSREVILKKVATALRENQVTPIMDAVARCAAVNAAAWKDITAAVKITAPVVNPVTSRATRGRVMVKGDDAKAKSIAAAHNEEVVGAAKKRCARAVAVADVRKRQRAGGTNGTITRNGSKIIAVVHAKPRANAS